ncbi:MAG: hypothetical protein HP495_01180, partial [Nitrospira sp.]|nr:hypothetical protein [Nitrospira sp.]
KVKTLSPDGDLVTRLAEMVRKASTGTTDDGEPENVLAEDSSGHRQGDVRESEASREDETQEIVILGAEPDFVSNSSNIFVRDDPSQAMRAGENQDVQRQAELIHSSDQTTQDQSSSLAAASGTFAAPHMGVKRESAESSPDYETHYALGVAYKNMGLYEDAKASFQIAMCGHPFYLDSALMTAVCLKEQQQVIQAIAGLEPVLADPRCHGAKGQAIRYELGLLYEAVEQWEKAAVAFQAIPSFHDVPQRLAALKAKGWGDVGFRYAA